METTENVIVAFEAPKYVLAHPDARIEYGQLGNAHGGYDPVVRRFPEGLQGPRNRGHGFYIRSD